jgi:hypothetical protein
MLDNDSGPQRTPQVPDLSDLCWRERMAVWSFICNYSFAVVEMDFAECAAMVIEDLERSTLPRRSVRCRLYGRTTRKEVLDGTVEWRRPTLVAGIIPKSHLHRQMLQTFEPRFSI